MSNSIVLGHPYEGAFYWLLSAEDWRKTSIKSQYVGKHPYYKTLYGKNPGKYVDETASLSILYKKIYLAPADCYLPDYQAYVVDGCYNNKDLGIVSDWKWTSDYEKNNKHIEMVLHDINKRHILDKVPPSARGQIVRGIIVQLAIAHRFKADIIANNRYLRLCQRIQEITASYENAQISKVKKALVNSLQEVFQISSLKFSLKSLDDFQALRMNRTLRRYAVSFRKQVENLPLGCNGEYALLKSMMEAIETAEISKRFAGGLEIGASLSNYVSLIPLIGTAAGVAGIISEHGAKTAVKIEKRKNWWMLAPEISKTLTRKRIEKRIKELESIL